MTPQTPAVTEGTNSYGKKSFVVLIPARHLHRPDQRQPAQLRDLQLLRVLRQGFELFHCCCQLLVQIL